MVVAEALAHGVPVIVSRGAPWKRVEEVGCGLWVENDRESLAEAVTRMSVMPLSTMGHRGREWMEKEFSWDLMASALARRYAEIMGRE
jgi:glycosyltransferase involved in cell wall biosynthesis